MILTPDQFRQHVVTAVDDLALGRLLDAAEAAIVEVAGVAGDDLVELVEGGFNRIVLSRPAVDVASVREASGSTWNTALASTDYELLGTSVLRRIGGRWAHRVEVTYTSSADAALRIQAQVKLVELELNYVPGESATTAGPFSEQFANNSAMNRDVERDLILSSLRRPTGMTVLD